MLFLSHSATEKILQKCPQIVDYKKDDGFSSLHLAALNGHKDVAATLLKVIFTFALMSVTSCAYIFAVDFIQS